MINKIIITALLGFFNLSVFAQEDPVKAFIDSASVYRLTGDTMEVYYLSKAISLQPYNPTLYELRAYAKGYIEADKNNNYGPNGAIKDFDIAIKLNPRNSNLYEQRGYQRFLIKQYLLALKDYNKAIRLNKKNASAYRKRGDLYWEYKNYPRAGNDFFVASELDTSSVYNVRKIGDCFYELGNLQSAVQYYNKAIIKAEKKTNFSEIYNEDYVLSLLYRGNSRGYMGAVDKAIQDYSEVIAYNEKFEGLIEYTQEAYKYRGMAYINEDKKKEGCEDLKLADSLGDAEAKEFLTIYCK